MPKELKEKIYEFADQILELLEEEGFIQLSEDEKEMIGKYRAKKELENGIVFFQKILNKKCQKK